MPTRRDVLQMGAVGLAGMHPLAQLTRQTTMSQTVPSPAEYIAQFENLAYGMFVHWGLYSQMGKGEWVQNTHGIPRAEYLKLMQSFTGKDFNAKKLAQTAKRSGMRYVTHTTRHHEGFSLYNTRGLSKLDVTQTPCKRDLIEEFTSACHAEGILPMLYHTTLDWNDERFEKDWLGYHKYLQASIELLCTKYGRIGGFWLDGNWSKPAADWHETPLYKIIRKHQPEAIIINNTGIDALGHGGHPEVDSVTYERGRPTPMDRRGAKKYVAGEMCHTMNFHWGTASKDFNYLSPAHVIQELCFARRAGANLLMNVGPLAQGAIPDYEAAALARVGDWLDMMGGAEGVMYRGRPCGVMADGEDFALQMGDELYLFVTDLTATSNSLVHGTKKRGPGRRVFRSVAGSYQEAMWIDNGEILRFEQKDGDLTLHATAYPYGTNTVVRVARLR